MGCRAPALGDSFCTLGDGGCALGAPLVWEQLNLDPPLPLWYSPGKGNTLHLLLAVT